MKPHTILLLSALLADCAAVFLTIAHHEPKAALASGYALLAGITALALYLSSRQKASRTAEMSSTSATVPVRAVVSSEDKNAQRPSNIATDTDVADTKTGSTADHKGATSSPYRPRYTSHSRA